MKKILLLVTAFALSACATTAREPSSVGGGEESSVELATKLNGGSIKFVAKREDGGVSLVNYFNLQFQNCTAVGVAGYASATDSTFKLANVECDVVLDSDPFRTAFRAKVNGTKRAFTIRASKEEENKYSFDAELTVSYEQKRWSGSGKISGWLNQKVGRSSNVVVTIKENLSF